MRVLMVSKACLVGIYQRKLEEIARLNGVELEVIVPPYWRDERGITPLEIAHTQGYELLVEDMALNGSFHLHFYPHLGRRIRAFRPDIVHMDEEPYNLATFHGMLLARRLGCRTLWFTWQNLRRRYPPPFSLFERYCVKNADAAIAGSHSAAQVWRSKGFRGPMEVIPQFGVDPHIFAPAGEKASQQEFVIGYAGRLVPEKGVDLLLQAASNLESTRVEILGSGPLHQELAQLAAQLNLPVNFRGTLPSTRMPEFYHQLDALVLPSRSRPNWVEQFGRVLIEAMSCRVPVVGAESGEIPHVIGDAGLTFPEGDVQALQERLQRLASSPALRAELGQKGRERVLSHYTQTKIAKQTVAVYQNML